MFEIDFIVGQEDFSDVTLVPTSDGHFYFFYNQAKKKRIRRFVLDVKPRVVYACIVTFIKKGERGTPRLHFITKDLTGNYAKVRAPKNEETIELKASVNLGECHENFWRLIAFLRTFREIEIPDEMFSLVSKDESVIVAGIRERRDVESVKSIVNQLLDGVNLSVAEVNVLLKRKERLAAFEAALKEHHPEREWQTFFEQNKWIFGYGLNYVILKVEEQPHVGGIRFDRLGGQNPDFLGITSGEVGFTVLVEIKTPQTLLLAGEQEIRNGAWSLSQELTDALMQIQANTDKWNTTGARTDENRDALEKQGVYTVKPKGILVIGSLAEVKSDPRSRRETFERFRQSVSGVEIITFDELHERAKFIVDHTS
jgi:hypothetical protein